MNILCKGWQISSEAKYLQAGAEHYSWPGEWEPLSFQIEILLMIILEYFALNISQSSIKLSFCWSSPHDEKHNYERIKEMINQLNETELVTST